MRLCHPIKGGIVTESTHEDDSLKPSRRDALKFSGAAAAAAAAMVAGGIGIESAAGATSGTAGTTWDAAQLSKFAGLMTKMWSNPSLLKQYNANPAKYLASQGLTLAAGTPAPVIPPKPAGEWGKTSPAAKAFLNEEWKGWSVNYNDGQGSVVFETARCFSSASCPVCTFGCLSGCISSKS